MNVPVNDDLRRLGGQMRDAGRPEWEKQFMGMLAGSARPLKKDNPAASDAVEAVRMLKTEAARFPWALLFLVGRDGNTVRATLSEADAIARVNQMGGAIGLAGFLFLREKFTPFVRPFIAGLTVERKLRAIVQKRWEETQEIIRANEDDASPVSATVYSDGQRAEVFYAWDLPKEPPKGYELAGQLFVVVRGKRWAVKARAMGEQWAAAMDSAIPLFNARVNKIIGLLNKAGLSLKDLPAVLPALVALGKNPELMKELEKKPK